ncbi:hypothetical protein HK101_000763 [Irineochytrium annulatum]|nr:hypothetical protein HK101_000763 [Irineochytrium annulatum]
MKPGDWLCGDCSYHNYASRRSCFKCSAPHPSGANLQAQPQSSSSAPGPGMKTGDWICTCGFQNFASRQECMRCRTRKPAGQQQQYGLVSSPQNVTKTGVSNKILPGDWLCRQCSLNNFASRTRCMQCGGPQAPGASVPHMPTAPKSRPTDRPGDWHCPNENCRYHNYSSRSECYRCGTKKVDDSGGYAQYGNPSAGAQMKPGDWICSREGCAFHNFAKRDTCAKCGSAGPAGAQESNAGIAAGATAGAPPHTEGVSEAIVPPGTYGASGTMAGYYGYGGQGMPQHYESSLYSHGVEYGAYGYGHWGYGAQQQQQQQQHYGAYQHHQQ